MRHCLPFLLLLLISSSQAQTVTRADKIAREGVAEFTAAYEAWDGARFAVAAGLFREACTNAPASSTNFYWLGAAEFHRMLQLQTQPSQATNQLAVDAAMDAALAALTAAVKLNERDAESHALLGTLYGMKIGGNLLRALRFGPNVVKHQKKALEFGAENPRVRYLLGTCQFHTAKNPTAQREALATLLVAEKLFVTEARSPAGPMEPRWGHPTCLTFIGRTYELLGERIKAADYFRQALTRQPSDYLAREGFTRVTERK
jgi:tetratricopeptide (TPR) repeat protein